MLKKFLSLFQLMVYTEPLPEVTLTILIRPEGRIHNISIKIAKYLINKIAL